MKKMKWILIIFLALGVIGAAFGEDSEKTDTPTASFSDTQEIDTTSVLLNTEKSIPETELPKQPPETVSDDPETPPSNDTVPETVPEADPETVPEAAPEADPETVPEAAPEADPETPVPDTAMVWLSATGDKYHSIPNCGRMNPNKATQVTLDDAVARGYSPCSKCY